MRPRRGGARRRTHRRDAMTNWLGLRDSTRYIARLAAVLLILGGGPAIVSATAAEENTVRLTVDDGDGVAKTISDLAWSKGNTVLDAMKAATSRSHGISFSYTGSGASAPPPQTWGGENN